MNKVYTDRQNTIKIYLITFFLFYANLTSVAQFWLLEQSTCSLTEKEEIHIEARKAFKNWSKEKELLFLDKTSAHPDERIQLYGLYNLGERNLGNNKFEVVEEYIRRLKDFKDPHWKSTAQSLARLLEGRVLVAKKKYVQATNFFFKILKAKDVNPYMYCYIYAELGYISLLNKDNSSIFLYYNKAIEQAEELDNLYLRLKMELDLFSCLNSLDKKNKKKHKDWSKEKATYSWENFCLMNIQSSYYIQNAIENFNETKYDTSIAFYLKAIDLKKQLNPENSFGTEYLGIAEAFFYKKEYKTTLEYIHKAQEEESNNVSSPSSKYLSLNVKVYRALKDYKQVDYYQELLFKKQKVSFEKEKQKDLAKYNKEFESAEKENLINEQELLIAQQNRKNLLYIFLFAFSSLLLTGLLYNYRRNQKLVRKEREFSQKTIELEQAQNVELQKIDDYRVHLFASLSHEFKTPLTLLKTPLEQMHNETFKGSYSHYYDLMLRNTNRLLELVEQMLTLSKLKHGKLKVNLQKLDITEIVQNVFIQFGGVAIKKGIKLELYAPKKPIFSDMDRDFFQKILGNLIQNAIKYSEKGGAVLVQSSTSNTHYKLTVRDTGEGIDKENIERIFEAFYREKSYKLHQKDGVGLGLSIVKELTDLLGGEIDIQSKKNVGTTISIFLPLAQDHKDYLRQDFLAYPVKTIYPSLEESQEKSIQTPRTVFEANSDSDKPIILVVEDNADLQHLIKNQLTEDFQIVPAFNGVEALSILETVHPNLILSDIMMDKMDGIQFAKKVQQDIKLSHIPIVLLSALDPKQTEREGLEAGAIDFIAKPVDFYNLRLQLHNILNVQNQKQEDVNQYILSEKNPKEVSKLVNIDQQFILNLKKIISENIHNENFSVETLSEKMDISRSTLFLKVKKLTGVSVGSFISKFRLAKAKKFLEHRQGNISEAAYSVGIYNLSYFSRLFKEEFGSTPRKFLKEQKEGKQPD